MAEEGDAPQIGAQPPLEEKLQAGGNGSDEKNMNNVRHLLVERMDPDSGLNDKLLQLGALTYPETGRIRGEKSVFERNEKLLELIFSKMKHQALLTALTDTGQKHLFNLVKGNGEYSPEYGTVWPLRERETQILDANRFNLVEIIEPGDLIISLLSKEVITNRQQLYINGLRNKLEKTETVLDILRRGSEECYWKTVSCLQETNQSHVAEILVDGGVLAQLHVSNEGEPEQVNEEEDHLVEALEALLQNTTLPEYHRIRERLHLRIIRSKKGKSVVFYIYCKAMDELLYLYELLTKGEFMKSIAAVFDLLIPLRKTTVSAVNWSEEEFTRFKTYFEGKLQHDEKVVEQQQQSSGKLQHDEKVVEQQQQSSEPPTQRKAVEGRTSDEEAGSQKSNVEAGAEARGTVEGIGSGGDDDDDDDFSDDDSEPDEGSEDAIRRKLKQGFGVEEGDDVEIAMSKIELTELTRMDVIAAIMRNTTEYLMEHMRTEGLIDKLHAAECLTDDDTRYIKTLSIRSERNDEILNVIDNEKKYNDLINCLRQTKQHLAADIVEKGGVVLKMKVTLKKVSLPDIEKHLVKMISSIHDKSVPKREEVLQFLSQLRRGSIEILDAQPEGRAIILWVWCRSEKALSNVRTWYKSKNLNKILSAFFRLLTSHQTQLPEVIRTNIEDIDMEYSAWPPKLDILHQLPVAEGVVCGVTTLPGKIFVLCQKPTEVEVLVFESQEYSKPSKRIPVSEVLNPVDIVACHQAACLYITDITSLSVWKVTTDDGKVTQWLQNVGQPCTLSLTSNGEVVMVRRGQPSTLEVYSSNGKKLHDIKLPPKITLPNHAVGTSAGTFFVSYGDEKNFSGIFEIDKGGNTIGNLDFGYGPIAEVSHEVNSILDKLYKEIPIYFVYPRYLALGKKDQLYAADFENGGLMVFDSQLCLEQVIGKEDVKETMRLCCGEEDNQLVIVHGEKRLLSIYKLSFEIAE